MIDRQVKTAHGAERYVRSGRPIFLDGKGTMSFPLSIDPAKPVHATGLDRVPVTVHPEA